MSAIGENLAMVRERIESAAARAGRDPESVSLIAVSKTYPPDKLREAYGAGQRAFGENRVQELTKKAKILCDIPVSWHMIGHLQLNKVKYLPGIVSLIHSVDSLKLAKEIDTRWGARGLTADILIEVNIAGEESKFGLKPSETPDFIRLVSKLSHVNVRGLMSVAPYTADPETNRPYFRGLKNLMEEINRESILKLPMDTLSMGMSGDFETAVEEGATLVRVGTAIFGARDYG